MATVCGAVEPAGSGTVVAALAGASGAKDAGAVAVGTGVGVVNELPLQAARADSAMRTGPNKSGPGRGKRMGSEGPPKREKRGPHLRGPVLPAVLLTGCRRHSS
jgi:hypothetical protein